MKLLTRRVAISTEGKAGGNPWRSLRVKCDVRECPLRANSGHMRH